MTTDMQNEPVKKFRIGAVTATIWKNEAEGRSFYRGSRSFGAKNNDLLQVFVFTGLLERLF
jgi:hypothetical protein